jgi:DNA gyrase subunit A
MDRLASEILADIDKETVDFKPNYDDKELEPVVLPTRVPNLLLNGQTGIAVGMATNIPPHNLNEIIDGTIALIANPNLPLRELLELIPGPDFPTGATIWGRSGILQAYQTGRGSIIVRGVSEMEELKSGKTAIIVSEIPYMVNKARWIETTAELVRDKKLEGISDIRDESDRQGIRVVFELRRDAVPLIVLNNLHKMTQLQTSFSINMLAIVDGSPRVLDLRSALLRFIEHRRDVVTRRSIYELREAKSRREIVEGLGLAVSSIDRVIEIIRSSREPDEARTRLTSEPLSGLAGFLERAGRPAAEVEAARTAGPYRLNERQAQAILDMRLARLTGLERDKLESEYRELWATTDRLEAILADDAKLVGVIVDELKAIKAQYGDERRTRIIDNDAEISDESLIAEEEMIVTVTHGGYVKRTPITEYRAQARGGKGVKGAESGDGDFVAEMFVAGTHDHILMFTDKGRVYAKRVFEMPLGARVGRGKAMVNLLELQEGEKVLTTLPVKSFDPGWYVVMATRSGTIKKTDLESFANIRATGIRAVTLDEGDALISVKLTDGEMDILLASRNGYLVRFREDKVRPMGRDARGVRGIALREGDTCVGMAVVPRNSGMSVLTVCERGHGKRTLLDEYPTKNRGGYGVITIKTSERNGKVVAVRVVSDEDHLILITDRGKLIRVPVAPLKTVGRATQGVRIMRVDEGEKISSVERLAEPDEGDEIAVAQPPAADESTEAEPEGEEILDEAEPEDEEASDEGEES